MLRILIVLSQVAGCYYLAGSPGTQPNNRPPTTPQLDAAGIQIVREPKRGWVDCDRPSRTCIVRRGRLQEQIFGTQVSYEIGGRTLTRAEVKTLLEPDKHAENLAHFDRLLSRCKKSIYPVPFVAVGVGLALYGLKDAKEGDTVLSHPLAIVGAGVAAVSYLTAYGLGRSCSRYNADIGAKYGGENGLKYFAIPDHYQRGSLGEQRSELVQAVEEFNAKLAPPAAEPAASEASAEP